MKAMFVNENGHVPYAQAICKRLKPVETRNKNMLSALVGERVAVVRTHRGKMPLVIGYVTIYRATHETQKVMNVCDHGHNYVCIYDSTANYNPYKLYRKWYDQGWHRKKVVEYQDFQSILWHLLQAEYGVR